jgi:acetylornithine deacetylase/succinyl-diaminopimelate desuccinylase-like protein
VIAAPPAGWSSDPFTLTGRNGYLYGRGATDNKGPVLAAACAAASLLGRRALEIDFVFLVEGEEEAGSGGFEAAVRRNKVSRIKTRGKTWRVLIITLEVTDRPYRCYPCQQFNLDCGRPAMHHLRATRGCTLWTRGKRQC